jgi:integrase/recombinase XerC
MHWRRTALRLLFRAGRRAGLADGDPTLDIKLPPRSSLSTRPLTNDEVGLCRSVAQWSLNGSRRAAVWALAEATCRSSELPHITADDIDLDSGRVWIAGGKATDRREGLLTGWGLAQVRARIEELVEPTRPLVYAGRSPAGPGQVSGAAALVDVLTRAGLHHEPDVRPGSVAAWAGRRVLDETGRIELAARALGVRSLDRAAGIVAWDWRTDPEPDTP